MVAAYRHEQNARLWDMVVNLVWPGLGQLSQRRLGAASVFGLTTAGLLAVLVGAPAAGDSVAALLLFVTACSIVDVAWSKEGR